MNVLYLCEYPSINGAENSLLAVLELLVQRGVSATVLAPEGGPFFSRLGHLERIKRIPWTASGESVFSTLTLEQKRRRLAEILHQTRPELVHANSLSMGRMSGPVLEELQIPGVSHIRDIIRLSRKAVEDLNRHARLFAVSEATRHFHLAQGVLPEKCVTLYNGVDAERFQPRKANGFIHREFAISENVTLIGSVGQLGLRKGQDLLLDALEPLLGRYDFHLLLIGERFSTKDEALRFEEELRTRANAFPFSERVHFLGVRDDVARIMNELSLLVHCAREEPLGRVLLEAASSGLAILASDVGGTAEILPGESQCFPKDDVSILTRKLDEFLRSPNEALLQAEQTRLFVQKRFSLETAAETLLKWYDSLV